MEDFDMTKMEATLDRLLQRATEPTVPQGAEERLMAVIRTTEQRPDIVVFKSQIPVNRWTPGLPLAASLLLDIYLGSTGTLDNYLPESLTGAAVVGATDSDLSTGLDELESYSDGELT